MRSDSRGLAVAGVLLLGCVGLALGQRRLGDSAHDACGLDCSSAFSAPNFAACLTSIRHSEDSGFNTTQVVFPTDAMYDQARSMYNSRFDTYPTAVFYAHDTNDVAAAVKCGFQWGIKVSPASGRQGFQGATIPTGYLIVDVSNLTQLVPGDDDGTLIAGAGNTGSSLQAALFNSGIPGVAVATGYCSFVHVSGWMLGGGFGLLGRYLGLGCDQVEGVEVVLFNGTVVQANKDIHQDLLWASCGGGGGTFGIVTSFTIRVGQLPNDGQLTKLLVVYSPGNASVEAWMRFQEWVPSADRRYGFTYSMAKGQLLLNGIFLGTAEEALAGLQEGNLLQRDLLDENSPASETSAVADEYPYGLDLSPQDSIVELVGSAVVNEWSGSPFGMFTPWEEVGFNGSPDQMQYLMDLMEGKNGLHVVGGKGYSMWYATQSRMVGNLPREAIEAVLEVSAEAAEQCADSIASNTTAGLNPACTFGIGGHVLGGAYADKPSDATAFPHRDKLAVMDATISMPNHLVAYMGLEETHSALGWPNRFLVALKPFLGEQESAYVNYLVDALDGWQGAYFGSNYPRLQQIKTKYDPIGVFDKPSTVQRK